MFVSGDRIPVTIDGQNTIFIRPKMDFGTRNRCMDALAAIGPADKGGAAIAMRLGEYNTALMANNIVAWQGPAFAGVECHPANIARLDPDEPLVEQVLQEIGRRNPLRTEDPAEKKGATSAGEPS